MEIHGASAVTALSQEDGCIFGDFAKSLRAMRSGDLELDHGLSPDGAEEEGGSWRMREGLSSRLEEATNEGNEERKDRGQIREDNEVCEILEQCGWMVEVLRGLDTRARLSLSLSLWSSYADDECLRHRWSAYGGTHTLVHRILTCNGKGGNECHNLPLLPRMLSFSTTPPD